MSTQKDDKGLYCSVKVTSNPARPDSWLYEKMLDAYHDAKHVQVEDKEKG